MAADEDRDLDDAEEGVGTARRASPGARRTSRLARRAPGDDEGGPSSGKAEPARGISRLVGTTTRYEGPRVPDPRSPPSGGHGYGGYGYGGYGYGYGPPPPTSPGGVPLSRPGSGPVGGGSSSADERSRLAHLEEAFACLTKGALGLATVASVDGDRMVLSMSPVGLVQVAGLSGARIGDTAVVERESLQVVEVVHEPRPPGVVAQVLEVDEAAGTAHVDVASVRRVVRTGELPGRVRVGDRLVLEPGLVYAVASLGRPSPAHAEAVAGVDVSWDDIGGQDLAKAQLREAVELPHEHPVLYQSYGKRPPKGVLLYGPPGTGKTRLGMATATSLARRYGRGSVARGGFVYVKGPEVVTGWMGQSEANVRAIFASAREFRREHGYPSVVFIDEADSLLGQRDRGPTVTLNATVVPQFLAELDGLEDSAAVLLLATNRPDLLDAAVTREKRVDRKIRVGRPAPADAVQIVLIHLRGVPVAAGEDAPGVARRVVDRLYTPGVLRVRDYGPVQLELRHLASGALLAEVVDQATTSALHRDVAAGRGEPGGVCAEDLLGALDAICRGQRDLDHGQVLYELAELDAESRAQDWAARAGDPR